MDEILTRFKKYFSIRELVDRDTFNKRGAKSWQHFDPRLIETMLILREALGKPINVNNWHRGGSSQQKGLRTNLSQLVQTKTERDILYLSAHRQGMALDFHVKGMGSEKVREWIVANKEIFPHKIRLEHKMKGKPISWVHLDVFDYEGNPHIYLFNV